MFLYGDVKFYQTNFNIDCSREIE